MRHPASEILQENRRDAVGEGSPGGTKPGIYLGPNTPPRGLARRYCSPRQFCGAFKTSRKGADGSNISAPPPPFPNPLRPFVFSWTDHQTYILPLGQGFESYSPPSLALLFMSRPPRAHPGSMLSSGSGSGSGLGLGSPWTPRWNFGPGFRGFRGFRRERERVESVTRSTCGRTLSYAAAKRAFPSTKAHDSSDSVLTFKVRPGQGVKGGGRGGEGEGAMREGGGEGASAEWPLHLQPFGEGAKGEGGRQDPCSSRAWHRGCLGASKLGPVRRLGREEDHLGAACGPRAARAIDHHLGELP